MASSKYVSRTREPVTYVWHTTQLDGSVVHQAPPYMCRRECVYRRADGTEFVNLREQLAVRRDGGMAVVDRHGKVVRSVSLGQVAAMGQCVYPRGQKCAPGDRCQFPSTCAAAVYLATPSPATPAPLPMLASIIRRDSSVFDVVVSGDTMTVRLRDYATPIVVRLGKTR